MKKIFFEKPFIYHFPLILYHLIKGDKVIVFDFDGKSCKKRWLRIFIKRGLINRYYYFKDKQESLALDSVDMVYKTLFKKSLMIKAMVDCYEDKDIEMAYKKELAWELSLFYAMQLILKQETEDTSFKGKIVLYPYKYTSFLNILKKCNCFLHKISNISIPLWMSFVSRVHQVVSSFMFYILFIIITAGLTFIGLVKKIASFKNGEKKFFKYAIAIKYPAFQFKFTSNRTFDFLLDGENIKKENTIFLILTRCSKSKISELRSKNYNMVDCSSFFKTVNLLSGSNTKGMLKKLVRYLFSNIFGAFTQQSAYLTVNIKLIVMFMAWSMMLDKYKFGHFISANDEGITHIGRNILLNKNDCTTWHYAHSGSLSYIFTNTKLTFYDCRMWLRSYLHYNNYLLWNKSAVDFMKMHPTKINNYFNVGCIWSESIRKSDIKDIETYAKTRGIKKNVNKRLKVLSFFDSSYFESISSKYSFRFGLKFYEDIRKLLSEKSDVFVIIKEKKPIDYYANTSDYPVPSEAIKKFALVLKKLDSHPRCYRVGFQGDPSEIIAVSDVTISYAFTSPTVEALCARKKAIFHDPTNEFHDYHYDKIPSLVSHDYEDLKAKIQNLLALTSSDYDEYLDKHIMYKVEDYLDGKAIMRFQDLIKR